MIEARALRKIYKNGAKELEVLKGIDLKVGRSEVLAVLGPSGAGKSTLLHLLGGLDSPTAGEVMIDGADIYALGDRERARIRNRKIGFVFQFYHLLPEFDALENVMLPLLIKGGDGRDLRERAAGLLRSVGLGERMSHKPGQLSGGEQQRVAIARALINEPELLLCDEPTGNLDSESGENIIELLWELNKSRKMTLIIVTHDAQIAKAAQRVLHIRDGKIIQ
jgi:lipoprotein-releasing system ATP-binding protein